MTKAVQSSMIRVEPLLIRAVRAWAKEAGYILLQEVAAPSIGRVDAVLVPTELLRRDEIKASDLSEIIGVEAKVSRTTFLTGLKDGQFLRYQERLSGLFVVTPPMCVSPGELPNGIGQLEVALRPGDMADIVPTTRCVRKAVLSSTGCSPDLLTAVVDRLAEYAAPAARVDGENLGPRALITALFGPLSDELRATVCARSSATRRAARDLGVSGHLPEPPPASEDVMRRSRAASGGRTQERLRRALASTHQESSR